jgi:hypothetical protein
MLPFNQWKYDDIMKQQLVIINGVKQLSSGLSSQLKTFWKRAEASAFFLMLVLIWFSYNSFLGMVKCRWALEIMRLFRNKSRQSTHPIRFSVMYFSESVKTLTLPKVTSGFASEEISDKC